MKPKEEEDPADAQDNLPLANFSSTDEPSTHSIHLWMVDGLSSVEG